MTTARASTKPLRWGLLLPITSRGSGATDCWCRLEVVASHLVESVPPTQRNHTCVHVAIDRDDPVYDVPEAHVELRKCFAGLTVQVEDSLPPAFQGKLCWIWARLASTAVNCGSDFFILLGDDVLLHSDNWQDEVEAQFSLVSVECQLPFGVACVAVKDLSFACFPTFPVMHRMHLDIFGELFPSDFTYVCTYTCTRA